MIKKPQLMIGFSAHKVEQFLWFIKVDGFEKFP